MSKKKINSLRLVVKLAVQRFFSWFQVTYVIISVRFIGGVIQILLVSLENCGSW
jgi:hypothetical protein